MPDNKPIWTHGCSLGSFYFFYFAILGAVVPMSLYFESIGFNPKQIGLLMSFLLITKIIAPNFWGYVVDKRSLSNPKFGTQTLIFSLVVCCVLFSFLNFTQEFLYFWL